MTHQTLNRYQTARARKHRRSRFITGPDYSINVTQKKCSHKETWRVHNSRPKAINEIDEQNHDPNPNYYNYWRDYGRRWKMRYRINVYLK